MNRFSFKNRYSIQVNERKPIGKAKDLTFILLPAIGVPVQKYEKLIMGLGDIGYSVMYADYPCCGENTPHISKKTGL